MSSASAPTTSAHLRVELLCRTLNHPRHSSRAATTEAFSWIQGAEARRGPNPGLRLLTLERGCRQISLMKLCCHTSRASPCGGRASLTASDLEARPCRLDYTIRLCASTVTPPRPMRSPACTASPPLVCTEPDAYGESTTSPQERRTPVSQTRIPTSHRRTAAPGGPSSR